MSELLFALFILLGFLSGTLIAGNLFFLFLIKLPNLVKMKLRGDNVIPLDAITDIIAPIIIWILAAIGLIYVISNYFNIYQKLFFSGISISVIFCFHTIINSYRQRTK